MKSNRRYPVNDISQCIEQAHLLSNNMQDSCIRERRLFRAFISLAGDVTTGLLAYAIWRGRSQLLAFIQASTTHRTVEEETSGASHARSRWQEESEAFDDLPSRRRPVLQWGKSTA